MVNFAYSLLESQIRQALNVIGADVACGILHADHQSLRDNLLFDCIEPLRGLVDDLLLTEHSPESPRRQSGEEGPARLADSACLCKQNEVAPCHLPAVWAFQGKTVPWLQAQPSRCAPCCTHARGTTRWGSVPAHPPAHSRRAGRCGHSSGAPGGGCGLARPVDGPRATALLRRRWGHPTCAAVIPTAKATAGEPISISRIHAGESQNTLTVRHRVNTAGDPRRNGAAEWERFVG